MAKKDDAPPKWFYDEDGERLGVIANEQARTQWYIDNEQDDPSRNGPAVVDAAEEREELAKARKAATKA